jgi:hypothetical protein
MIRGTPDLNSSEGVDEVPFVVTRAFSLKFIHIFDIICVFARGGEE